MQRPLREDVAPREQTAPEPPAPTFESDGVVLPNPQATILLDGVPYGFVWCASDYIDSCTLEDPSQVWDDPAVQERYREVVVAGAGLGRRAPVPDRRGVGHGDPQPDHAALPAPATLARGRRRRAGVAEAAGLEDDRRALGGRRGRAPDPRRVARRRARVRAPALPAVHRHRARRARGRAWPAGSPTRTSRRRRYHRPGEPSSRARSRSERGGHDDRRTARRAAPVNLTKRAGLGRVTRHPPRAPVAAPRRPRALALPRAARDARLARRRRPLQADVPRHRVGDPRPGLHGRWSTSSSSASSRTSRPEA